MTREETIKYNEKLNTKAKSEFSIFCGRTLSQHTDKILLHSLITMFLAVPYLVFFLLYFSKALKHMSIIEVFLSMVLATVTLTAGFVITLMTKYKRIYYNYLENKIYEGDLLKNNKNEYLYILKADQKNNLYKACSFTIVALYNGNYKITEGVNESFILRTYDLSVNFEKPFILAKLPEAIFSEKV